ncbi:UNVERIFIED_ORG: hypothetical protein ABID57_001280 [Arthrobacter sp. UYEF1]
MGNFPLGTQSPKITASSELTISLPARYMARFSASAPRTRPELVSMRTRASARRISVGQNLYEPCSRGFWTSIRWSDAPCNSAVAAPSRSVRSAASLSTRLVIRTVSHGITKATRTPKANVTTPLDTASAKLNGAASATGAAVAHPRIPMISPSVGALSGAVCDNPNPTDGELNPGAATSPNGAAPAPTQTTVQE